MKFEIEIKNAENVRGLQPWQHQQIADVFEALISTGGLTGVKGGQTIVHFDAHGVFQKVELKYFPWVRRSLDKKVR